MLKQLRKFADATVSLSERRNRAAHDLWFLDNPEFPIRLEATAKKELRLLPISVPTIELAKLVGDISQHISRLYELCEQLRAELTPSRDTQPPTSAR